MRKLFDQKIWGVMSWLVSLLAMAQGVCYGEMTVLHDDFNDGILDPTKWSTNVTLPNAAVLETSLEGRLQSVNRGFLNSYEQWKPGMDKVPILDVTGMFRLPNQGDTIGDIALIASRSSGVPRASVYCGAVQDGIEFGVSRQPLGPFGYVMWIDLHVGPNQDTTLDFKSFEASSEWYWFKMQDDGRNIRAWVNLDGNFTGPPDLHGLSDHKFGVNYVSFYGRSYEHGLDHTTYFDDITISVIPAPGALVLGALGLGTSLTLMRKRIML